MPVNMPDPTPQPSTTPQELLDKMAALSTKLRDQATVWAEMANAIDDVALDIEARVQAIEADAAKLRQLRELLGSIAVMRP